MSPSTRPVFTEDEAALIRLLVQAYEPLQSRGPWRLDGQIGPPQTWEVTDAGDVMAARFVGFNNESDCVEAEQFARLVKAALNAVPVLLRFVPAR